MHSPTHGCPIGTFTGDIAVGGVEVNNVGSLAIAVAIKETSSNCL